MQGSRLCSYTGMLYCLSCHTNASAIIPARVLHHWDFTRRPVSALAAEFLSSTASQPLLCVGAVNPGLYTRVPALARALELRSRAVKALAAARANGSVLKVHRGCVTYTLKIVVSVPSDCYSFQSGYGV